MSPVLNLYDEIYENCAIKPECRRNEFYASTERVSFYSNRIVQMNSSDNYRD